MKFNLFSYLNYSIVKGVEDTRAKRFYDVHSGYLSQYVETHKYLEARTSFEINSANIVIKALMNKKYVETKANLAAKTGADDSIIKTSNLPYLMDGDHRIIVPFFSTTINDRYVNSPKTLSTMPYKALKTLKSFSFFYEDPIEKYGYKIFDSEFTQFIPLMKSPMEESYAFVDLEIDTIYIITNQGTLERTIPFFDEDLKNSNRRHLLNRLHELMEAYYSFDKLKFIDSLFSLELISEKLYTYIMKQEEKVERRSAKKKAELAKDDE